MSAQGRSSNFLILGQDRGEQALAVCRGEQFYLLITRFGNVVNYFTANQNLRGIDLKTGGICSIDQRTQWQYDLCVPKCVMCVVL